MCICDINSYNPIGIGHSAGLADGDACMAHTLQNFFPTLSMLFHTKMTF